MNSWTVSFLMVKIWTKFDHLVKFLFAGRPSSAGIVGSAASWRPNATYSSCGSCDCTRPRPRRSLQLLFRCSGTTEISFAFERFSFTLRQGSVTTTLQMAQMSQSTSHFQSETWFHVLSLKRTASWSNSSFSSSVSFCSREGEMKSSFFTGAFAGCSESCSAAASDSLWDAFALPRPNSKRSSLGSARMSAVFRPRNSTLFYLVKFFTWWIGVSRMRKAWEIIFVVTLGDILLLIEL